MRPILSLAILSLIGGCTIFACTTVPPDTCGSSSGGASSASSSSSGGMGGAGGQGGEPTCLECASCDDGKQNQGETDVDCGGPCDPCGLELHCYQPDDCDSHYCEAEVPGTQGQCAVYPECLTCKASLSLHEMEEHCSEDEAIAYQTLRDCACDADPLMAVVECADNLCAGVPTESDCAKALANPAYGCAPEYTECIQ